MAAGLAGGSSDAAAAIDAALEAWGADLSAAGRHAAATSVGSDVAFFQAGGWALIEGRGEHVTRIPSVRGAPPHVLLVTPAAAVSTPAVFAAWAAGARGAGHGSAAAASRHLADELRAGMTSRALLVRAGILAHANDLMPAAQHVAARARRVPAWPHPDARDGRRAVGFRTHVLGHLSFAGGRGRSGGRGPGRARRRTDRRAGRRASGRARRAPRPRRSGRSRCR